MPIHRFGDARLVASVEQHKDHLTLTLEDVAAGHRWGPVRLFTLEVFDKMQDRPDHVEAVRIDAFETMPDGVHVSAADPMRRVALGLWLRIDRGELVVRVQPAEVHDHNPLLYRLFAIDILPGLMSVGKDGQMLLPLNTGVLTSPANKPAVSDTFLIYGEQPRWELMPMTPVAGVSRSVAGASLPGAGLVVLASQGACETRCSVNTDGRGNGGVTFGMHWRSHWPDPVEFSIRELRYSPIDKGSDLLHAAAKRLRRHVIDDLKKPTLEQRAKESPEVAYALSAYVMKLFFGIQAQGIMMQGREDLIDPRFKLVMTFDECGAALRKLHALGIDRIYTQSVGWNPRGHDGAWPTRFPIDERLGGEARFRALIALGHELGYRMNVHDNYVNAYEASPDFNADRVLWDRYGSPDIKGFWGGGNTFMTCVAALSDEYLRSELNSVRALGISGPYYIDGMGNPLYVNYHPKHRSTRTQYAHGVNRLLAHARALQGSVATECAFLYCSILPDLIVTCGAEWHMKLCKPEWPITKLFDQRVPFWQLAMSGLIMVEEHGESWHSAMRCVLFGHKPRAEWSTRPGVMPVIDDAYAARLKAMYDVCVKRFGHLQTRQMLTHRFLATNVEETTFDDGTTVRADFGRNEMTVNGKVIEKPAVL